MVTRVLPQGGIITIALLAGVLRWPGFRTLDSTCMKFSKFNEKVLDFLFADSVFDRQTAHRLLIFYSAKSVQSWDLSISSLSSGQNTESMAASSDKMAENPDQLRITQ